MTFTVFLQVVGIGYIIWCMQRLARLFRGERLFVLVLSTVLIFVSFVPFVYQWKLTPPGKVFLGTHNSPLDYPMFLSEIIQAKRGRWTVLAKFTSEEQMGTLVHPLYIPLGKMAAFLPNVPPMVFYHLSRLFVAFLFSFSVYYFIGYVFKNSEKITKRLAFFLALFSAGLMQNGKPYVDSWSGGDVFRRSVFLPHGMLKNVLLLLILVWMGKFFEGGRKKYFVWSCLSSVLLGLLDPLNTVTIWAIFSVYIAWKGIAVLAWKVGSINFKTALSDFFDKCLFLFFYFLVSFSAFLYIKIIFEITPWKVVREWESIQITVIKFIDLANSIGVTFYLGMIGLLILFLRRRSLGAFYCFVLTFPPIIFIISGITQKMGVSLLRFFQYPTYVFLAIGSAELLSLIFGRISKFYSKIAFITCIAVLFISFPYYRWSMDYQLHEFKPEYGNIYIEGKLWRAAMWLYDNANLDDVVLTDYMAGSVLPGISGNNVYFGHQVSTINFFEKMHRAEDFYYGNMQAGDVKKLIADGRINYVLAFNDQEQRIDSRKLGFLKKIYSDKEGAAIYKVEDN